MKTSNIKNIARGLIAATFLVILGAGAQAGPGSHENYVPVKTMKQAESIHPGERLAVSCGNCGTVTTFVADKDRSYLRGYTCETCRKKFVTHTNPHGAMVGLFVYEDDAGHQSKLYRAN